MRRRTKAVSAALAALAGVGVLYSVGPTSADASSSKPVSSGSAAGPTGLRSITDAQGRALLLRGINETGDAKNTPDGLPATTEESIAALQNATGGNHIRFLIFWKDVEPQPGVYDDAYLAKVQERVGWYAKRGIYVTLDMHQDVWGPYNGKGNDGAPLWATKTDGLPIVEQANWSETYTQPGIVRAFDNFWNTTGNGTSLQDHYVAAWRHVAKFFAGKSPNLIGYDLMNEPFGGSLSGPAFEAGPLAHVYQKAIDAIRTADADTWIMAEPSAGSVNWGFASALPALRDPRQGAARIVYAPHLYPLTMDLGQSYADSSSEVDATVDAWLRHAKDQGRRMNAPVVLGEFGESLTDKGNPTYLADVVAKTGEAGIGFAWWSDDKGSWGPLDKDGKVDPASPLAIGLNQAYPQAVAGLPTGSTVDAKHALTFGYAGNASVTAPTLVYLPPTIFTSPFGGTVTSPTDAAGSFSTSFDPTTHVLSITAAPTAGTHTFTVSP